MRHFVTLLLLLIAAHAEAGIFLSRTTSTCGRLVYVQGLDSPSEFEKTMDSLEQLYEFHTFLITKNGQTEPFVVASPKYWGSTLRGVQLTDDYRIESVRSRPNFKNVGIAAQNVLENHVILVGVSGGATAFTLVSMAAGIEVPLAGPALLGGSIGAIVGTLVSLPKTIFKLLASSLPRGGEFRWYKYKPLDSGNFTRNVSIAEMPKSFAQALTEHTQSDSRGVLLFESATAMDRPQMALLLKELQSLGYTVENSEVDSLVRLVNPTIVPNTVRAKAPTNPRILVGDRPLRREGATLGIRLYDRSNPLHAVYASSVLGGKQASESALMLIHPRLSEELYLLTIPTVSKEGLFEDSMVIGLGIKRSNGYFLLFNKLLDAEQQKLLSEQFTYVLSGDRRSLQLAPSTAIVLDQTMASSVESSVKSIEIQFLKRLQRLGVLGSLATVSQEWLDTLEARLDE